MGNIGKHMEILKDWGIIFLSLLQNNIERNESQYVRTSRKLKKNLKKIEI